MTATLVDARPLLKASALHLLLWFVFAAMIFMVGPIAAKSVLLGAAIAVVPAITTTWAVFRFRKAVAPQDYIRAIYRGELGKFLLTIMLFAIVFVEGGLVQVTVLFGTFLAAMVVQWLLSARHLLSN